MGMNYYFYEKPDCVYCGRAFERIHIGKSSTGWCFGLQVIPELGIHTLADWRKKWAMSGSFIRNEDGDLISVESMEQIIIDRSCNEYLDDHTWWSRYYQTWWSRYYQSEQDFHDRNDSERGPNGLLRHRIGRSCCGHGEGTWDYIVGEFS